MAAITWRNVDAPSLGDPTRTLGMAQQSINSIFDVAGGLLNQGSALVDANWKAGKDLNTAKMLQTLSQFRTPEEAQAAMNNGTIADMREQFGAQLDMNKVQASQDSLVENLQRRSLATTAYNNAQTDAAEKDVVGQFIVLGAQGKFEDARAGINASSLSGATKAKALADILAMEQSQGLYKLKQDEALRNGRLTDAQILNYQAEAQARLANAQKAGQPKIDEILKITEQSKQSLKQAQSANIFGGATYDSPEGQKATIAMVDSTGTFFGYGNSATYAAKVVDELKGKGLVSKDGKSFVYRIGDKDVQVPITAAVLNQVIAADDAGWTSPRVGSTANKLAELLKSPEMVDSVVQYHNNKANLERLDKEALAVTATGSTASLGQFNSVDPTGLATTMANYRQRQIDQAASEKAKQDQRLQEAIDSRKKTWTTGSVKPNAAVSPALQAEQEKALREAQTAQRNLTAPLLGSGVGGYGNLAVPGATVGDKKKVTSQR